MCLKMSCDETYRYHQHVWSCDAVGKGGPETNPQTSDLEHLWALSNCFGMLIAVESRRRDLSLLSSLSKYQTGGCSINRLWGNAVATSSSSIISKMPGWKCRPTCFGWNFLSFMSQREKFHSLSKVGQCFLFFLLLLSLHNNNVWDVFFQEICFRCCDLKRGWITTGHSGELLLIVASLFSLAAESTFFALPQLQFPQKDS